MLVSPSPEYIQIYYQRSNCQTHEHYNSLIKYKLNYLQKIINSKWNYLQMIINSKWNYLQKIMNSKWNYLQKIIKGPASLSMVHG